MRKKYFKIFIKLGLAGLFLLVILFFTIGGGFGERPVDFVLNEGKPLVFAHKGMENYYLENSLEGYEAAKELGFKSLETDVKRTKDKRLILFHDGICDRLLGIDVWIDDLNYEDIKDTKIIYQNKRSEHTIPTLETFLIKNKDAKVIYLDIKRSTVSTADTLLYLFEKYDLYEQVLVADERVSFLSYLKFFDPKIKTILEEFNHGSEWKYYWIPKNFKPDFYGSDIQRVDDEYLDFLKSNQLVDRKIVYGVTHKNIEQVYQLGLKHIIIDYHNSLGSPQAIEEKLSEHTIAQ